MRSTEPELTVPDVNRSQPLHVAVAVIQNDQGQYLISQRSIQSHQGGLWEFPGGKVEPGETTNMALAREILEETGLVVEDAEPLIRIRHDYPKQSVLLDVWLVRTFRGEAVGRESQPIRWVAPEEFNAFDFPAANHAIIQSVRLPRFYPILDDAPNESDFVLLRRLDDLIEQGHSLVQLRLKHFKPERYAQTVAVCIQRCRQHKVRVLLNADIETALELGADGVHLNRHRLAAIRGLPNLPDSWLMAASCHDEQELRKAASLGVDFAVLSPVIKTPSHPDGPFLGWDGFRDLVDMVSFPVFALGGMCLSDYQTAITAGAQGLSGIRLFVSAQ